MKTVGRWGICSKASEFVSNAQRRMNQMKLWPNVLVFVTLLYTGVFIYFAEIQLNSRLCGWLIQEWTSNISVTVYDDSALHSFISSWDPWHSADLHKVCTKFQLRRQIIKSANHEEWWMVTWCLAHLLNTQPLTTSLPFFVMPQLSTDSSPHH